MSDRPLVIQVTSGELREFGWTDESRPQEFSRPLLSCGHYGKPVFMSSSTWDFPDDLHDCPECLALVQFDVRVQAVLYEDILGPVA